ncbi:hypothetical protein [Halapricum desulfuricans]|uniref:Putative membrane protein n=1 Tax=Halapricum desulfuricans TaxID=2841257 RepID=A0A897NSG2_9EURY|nr:hypothetical protein [Halapricum desulfuricans]QSG15782.1 putative membrane protein [Halapricum desulfuricans]
MTDTDDTDDDQTDQSTDDNAQAERSVDDDGQSDRSIGTPPSGEETPEPDDSSDDASTASEDKSLGSTTDSVTGREEATNDRSMAGSTAGTSPSSTDRRRDTGRRDRHHNTERTPREYLELFALIGLGLFAAVSAYGFYVNANRAIAQLAAATHESLFQAAFNLTLLLLALAGLSLLARRRFDLP